MMNGPYTPTVSLMNSGTTNTITASVNMPPQRTPSDIREYLINMGFTQTALSGSEIWTNNLGYYTWEQAVVYCLIKPFLNP
jgi:hypothetical protein